MCSVSQMKIETIHSWGQKQKRHEKKGTNEIGILGILLNASHALVPLVCDILELIRLRIVSDTSIYHTEACLSLFTITIGIESLNRTSISRNH